MNNKIPIFTTYQPSEHETSDGSALNALREFYREPVTIKPEERRALLHAVPPAPPERSREDVIREMTAPRSTAQLRNLRFTLNQKKLKNFDKETLHAIFSDD